MKTKTNKHGLLVYDNTNSVLWKHEIGIVIGKNMEEQFFDVYFPTRKSSKFWLMRSNEVDILIK